MNTANRVYAYLRASTKEQDADRGREALIDFAEQSGLSIASFFVENESGATLDRPELFKLLEVAQAGDVLLVEQIDRISRLNNKDWEHLKGLIKSKGIRIVSLDLPTSHQLMTVNDEFTNRMLSAINDLLLDLLATVARKDYQDRKRRQKEGIAKAKEAGRYKGKQEDKKLLANIELLLTEGKSYTKIMEMLRCSRGTIAKVSKRLQKRATGSSSL